MATVLSVGTTTSSAFNIAPDTSGSLQIQTNGSTTAMTLDTAQNAIHVGSVSAPNTFGFKNRIINGGMGIDQRNAGASVNPADAQYIVDRWQVKLSQTSKFTIQQNAGSVTPPAGFKTYLGFTSLAATTPASSDFYYFVQTIEGFNFYDFNFGTANAVSPTSPNRTLTVTIGGNTYYIAAKTTND